MDVSEKPLCKRMACYGDDGHFHPAERGRGIYVAIFWFEFQLRWEIFQAPSSAHLYSRSPEIYYCGRITEGVTLIDTGDGIDARIWRRCVCVHAVLWIIYRLMCILHVLDGGYISSELGCWMTRFILSALAWRNVRLRCVQICALLFILVQFLLPSFWQDSTPIRCFLFTGKKNWFRWFLTSSWCEVKVLPSRKCCRERNH